MESPVSELEIEAAEACPADPTAVMGGVQRQADAYVAFVRRLAEIESPSTDPDAQHAVQRVLADAFADLDFHVQHVPGPTSGGCLYARPADRDRHRPIQLLLGHCDTVWAHGTLDRMPVTRDGDRLHGPGTFDMKAGLASIVFALRILHVLGHRPPLTPVVLVTSDEEVGSHDSRRFIEGLARAAQRVFVTEPALGVDGKIKTARKSSGELTIQVEAANATGTDRVALELSRLVQRLHRMNDAERGVSINVGTINVTPDGDTVHGSLTADIRVRTIEDARAINADIRALTAETPGLDLVVTGEIERPPLERTPRNQRLWQCAQRYGAALGLDLEEGRAGGASDGNFTSLHAATLDGLGAVGDGAHAEHEHIHVPRTLKRCALLALLLLAPPTDAAGA
jgi:glutamate carboxypeptidase